MKHLDFFFGGGVGGGRGWGWREGVWSRRVSAAKVSRYFLYINI